MKLMFASDIHGSKYYCGKLMERWNAEAAGRLILLGDILYHGPRNDLPREYDPKSVLAALNGIRESICCVRGNCDSEVDQMVLEFPIMADSLLLFLEGRTVFATHGHIYNTETPPKIGRQDILLHGHTHVQAMEDTGKYIYINPGSVSLPKEGNQNSYMVYEDGVFTIKNMEGEPIRELSIR